MPLAFIFEDSITTLVLVVLGLGEAVHEVGERRSKTPALWSVRERLASTILFIYSISQ